MIILVYNVSMERNCEKAAAKRDGVTSGLIPGLFALSVCLLVIMMLTNVFTTGEERYSRLDATPAPTYVPTAVPTDRPTPEEITAVPVTPTPEPTLEAYVKTDIIVDGNYVCTLASRQAAELLLTGIIEYYADLCGADPMMTSISNEVTLEDAAADTPQNDVMSYDDAFNMLTASDTVLCVICSRVSYQTESIEHEQQVFSSDDFYTGTRFVKTYGSDGKNARCTEYIYINGELASSVERTFSELCSVTDEVILIGTHPLPETPTNRGDFGLEICPEYPYRIREPIISDGMAPISKYYGFYDGVLFPGVDFRCSEGEACYAALSGRVIAILNRGAYGLMIDIEHDGGAVTRYAGLASVCVSIGDTVETRDMIGTVGANDLHFEFILEGRPLNPRVYLYMLLSR